MLVNAERYDEHEMRKLGHIVDSCKTCWINPSEERLSVREMQLGAKSRKWMIWGFVSVGMAFLIFLLLPDRAAVEGGVLCKTNNVFGRQVVVLAITNLTTRAVSLTVLMGRMENRALKQDIWILPGPIPLNGKATLDLDVEVPWQGHTNAVRWNSGLMGRTTGLAATTESL
jgi:hypothetical protein